MNGRSVVPLAQAAGALPPRLSRLAWSPWTRVLAVIGVIGGATLWLAVPASTWLALAERIAGVLRSFYGTRGQTQRIAGALARLPLLLVGLSGASYVCMLVWTRILRHGPAIATQTAGNSEWRRCDRHDTVVMVALAAVALALRLPGMTQSLWLDELAMLKTFVEPGPFAAILPRSSLGSHPLSELLAWCAMSLGGTREWVLRVPALLAGILAVPLTYVAALGLSGRKATASMAAVVVAVHSYHAYYSFQLKGYTLVSLLALASISLLVRLLQRPSRRTAVALVVVNVLLVYTHLFALYFCVAEYVVVTCLGLWRLRPIERPPVFPRAGWHELWLSLVGTALGVAILYLPQLPVLAMNALDPANQFGAVGHSGQVAAGCSVLLSAHESAWLAGLFLIALAMHFAVPRRREALDTLVFVLVLFVTLVAVGPSGGGGFYPRYLSPGLLLTAIVVGDVVARLCSVDGQLGRIGGIALLVAVLACTAIGYRSTYLPIQDFRGAVRFVEGHAAPGAIVVGNCFGKDLLQHYDARIVPLTGPDQLRALLTRSQQIWAITSIGCDTGRWPFEYDKDSQASIEQRFKLETELSGEYPVRVWRYDAVPVDPQGVVARDSPGSTRD
jgi:hypothetical protein